MDRLDDFLAVALLSLRSDAEIKNLDCAPCSLELVLNRFYPEIKESPALKTLQAVEKLGLEQAVKQGIVKEGQADYLERLRKSILSVKPTPSVGFVVKRLLEYSAEALADYDAFMTMLYNALRVQGLVEEFSHSHQLG